MPILKTDNVKKIAAKDLEEIIRPLPASERMRLREQDISPAWLQENIAQCKILMKRDLWVGPVWFVAYAVSLFLTRFSNYTIGLFVVGALYFTYTALTTGSFGLNRKRVQAYEKLLKKLEN